MGRSEVSLKHANATSNFLPSFSSFLALTGVNVASPRVLPVYPSFYLKLRQHFDFVEFYPSKRHRKPILLLIKRGSI
jgi:hypothetical protein